MIAEHYLQEIEKRIKAATEEQWHVFRDDFDTPTELAAAVSVALKRGGTTLWGILAGLTPEEAQERAQKANGEDAGYKFPFLTGNGPTSEANAHFVANAKLDLLVLIDAVRTLQFRLEALEEVAESTRRFHADDLEREEPVKGCTCTLCSIRFAFKKLDAVREEKQS